MTIRIRIINEDSNASRAVSVQQVSKASPPGRPDEPVGTPTVIPHNSENEFFVRDGNYFVVTEI